MPWHPESHICARRALDLHRDPKCDPPDYRLPMFRMRAISPTAFDNRLRRLGNRRVRDPGIQRFLRELAPKDKRVRGAP